MHLTFLGAAGTVTGSRYLVSTDTTRVLVDCGLFQGLKSLRLRNREPFPVPPDTLEGVVLTHAHIDHTGALPLLVREGFDAPICATAATRDLCEILLPDSGRLQEQEADQANRYGYSKHHPALPLYTEADARNALEKFVVVERERPYEFGDLTFRLRQAGHIPGASSIEVTDGKTVVVFSGDLGRPGDPLLHAPEPFPHADYLVVESTYGDRLHAEADPQEALAAVVRRTAARGGVIVIPAFAVGRAQSLLFHLHALFSRNAVPRVPVFLDSPMAADATRIFQEHPGEHRLTAAECAAFCRVARIVNSVDESKAIDRRDDPMVVISASGMATGGRVLFHLERFLPDPKNTVLFAGYQAAGTRGASLLGGAKEVKIRGRNVPARAEVVALDGLSAHADYRELLGWMRGFESPPRETFMTHGEPAAADALRHRVSDELGWSARVPEHGETVELG